LFWPVGGAIEALAWSVLPDSFGAVFVTISIDIAVPTGLFGTILLLVGCLLLVGRLAMLEDWEEE